MHRIFLLLAFFATTAVATPTYVAVHAIKAAPAASNHLSNNSADSYVVGYPTNTSANTFLSLQCNWVSLAGTLNAAVELDVSQDNGVNWNTKSGTPFTITSANGSQTVSLNTVVSEPAYRISYTANGVTGGTLDCYLNGK